MTRPRVLPIPAITELEWVIRRSSRNGYPDGRPPAVNAGVRSAWARLADYDDRTFIRHLTQVSHGHYGEELANEMLERIPPGIGQAYSRANVADTGEWRDDALRDLRTPLLFAEHDGCLFFTREGYAAAVDAFPDAMTVSCPEKPSVSAAFAGAIETFCRERLSELTSWRSRDSDSARSRTSHAPDHP
jgi:hypothetical protein